MDLFNLVEGFENSKAALSKIRCPVLVLGSKTDILFPIWQQKQLADGLIESGLMTSGSRSSPLSLSLSLSR
jgi:homoserine acetyltransferase